MGDNFEDYGQYMNAMNILGQTGGAQVNPLMFGAMGGIDDFSPDFAETALLANMMGNGPARPHAPRGVANPMSTCFAILGQLNAIDDGNTREFVVASAIQQQTVDPLCASQLIKEVDDESLREQLRAMVAMQTQQNVQPS